MKRLLPAALACALLLPAIPATAADLEEIVFSAVEKQIIRDYYREHGGKQKGKGKPKGLPPGIVKNLQRGKPLPPGIAKQRLPDALNAKLPPPPKGHERIVIDGRILLVDIATRVIRDKLEEAVLD